MTTVVLPVVAVVVVGGGGKTGGLAVFVIWPRISPAAFRAVWTFTYVLPASRAVIVVAFTLAEPRAPDRHGPHSETRTAPARPRTPTWMWDAVAFPVKPWKLSRQESFPPEPLRTSPAVNVPCAPARTPFGFGISCAALSRAVKPVVVALSAPCSAALRPVQIPAARSAGSATALATKLRLFTLVPPVRTI